MDEKAKNRELLGAIEEGDFDGFCRLCEATPQSLKQMTPFGTWLHIAASFGRLDIAKYLIDQGLHPNERGGTFGGNALNLAASKGHVEMVEYLIACGSELDVSEPERNPLFSAVYGGHQAVVALLLSRGIDSSVRYNGTYMRDMDAKAFAKERGHTDIAQMFHVYH